MLNHPRVRSPEARDEILMRGPPQVFAMRTEAFFTLIGGLFYVAGVTLILATMFGAGGLLELLFGFMVASAAAATVGLSLVDEA